MPSELLGLPAPAKLNLFLHVTGRRDDGYHLLETVFQFIELADDIDLILRDDGVIRRLATPVGVPERLDLTLRAARALQAATGCPLGVDIGLRKRVPIGAGLGGGSSDAATVLLGLNRLWRLGLDRRRLIEIAKPLGSDVPVFVFGRNAYATGVGDRLRPIRLPQRWFVLLMPPVAIETASVFSDPKLTRNTKPITISGFSRTLMDSVGGPRSDFRKGTAIGPARSLGGRNDLESVVFARESAVQRARDALAAAAGAGVVRMTGSGACVFAALESAEEARAVAGKLRSFGPKQSSAEPQLLGDTGFADSGFENVQNVGSVLSVAGLAVHPLGSRQVG